MSTPPPLRAYRGLLRGEVVDADGYVGDAGERGRGVGGREGRGECGEESDTE